jgi:putative phosphoesterase
MQIGIISDTHDHHRNVRRAVDIFNEEGVQYVLHAGDITSVSTAELFAGLRQSRLIAVFGNCDADRASLRAAIEAVGGEVHRDGYEGGLDSRVVHMRHIPDALGPALEANKYDLVIYGHTHRQTIHQVGRTLVINPGAATNRTGPPGHVVILDTADLTTTVRSLEA